MAKNFFKRYIWLVDLLSRQDAIFGIEIKNDRSLGFYIASSDMDGDSTSQWMLH